MRYFVGYIISSNILNKSGYVISSNAYYKKMDMLYPTIYAIEMDALYPPIYEPVLMISNGYIISSNMYYKNGCIIWLGGGALAAGGGGMAAGEAFLTLAGPVGWAIAGVALLASGLLLWKTKADQKSIEEIFTAISQRDIRSYDLAIVELNERILRIIDGSTKLRDAIDKIKSFGLDYNTMDEKQQYELGSYVNLMSSSTQLLVNPIVGLLPKFTAEDFERFVEWQDRKADAKICKDYKDLLISLANFLYKIDLNDRDKKLLWKSLRKNKKMLKSMDISKKEFDLNVFDAIQEALNYKYSDDVAS